MKNGDIILLNGTSSSGKSSIARALQENLDEWYLHTGIDHFMKRLPNRHIVFSDVSRPASAEGWLALFRDDEFVGIRIGPKGYRFLAAMYQAIAALAAAGINVIADDVIYDDRVLESATRALTELDVLFVGVYCSLEVAEQRERARGDRSQGGARVFHQDVHKHGVYDVIVDSGKYSAEECALRIRDAIAENRSRDAFRRLRERYLVD